MSRIEWTDESWNPVTGCTEVSSGCKNCYAKRMANRLRGRYGYPADDPFRVTLHPDRLDQPQHWRKPRMVFVCSMGDLFHPDVSDDFINKVFWIMTWPFSEASRHTYQILTKRPERILNGSWSPEWERIWLGVSVEDQKTADERIPILLQIPAAVRFVSYEPALGPVDLEPYLSEVYEYMDHELGHPDKDERSLIDGVILGGESGPGARPMHPDWARSVRDQCQAAGVPFFFKQWGEWGPHQLVGAPTREWHHCHQFPERSEDGLKYLSPPVFRYGKKWTGRLLDGREHNELPE